MTIKKKLLLSNLGMIIVPILCFFLIEIVLGMMFFVFPNQEMEENSLRAFVNYRFLLMLLVIILTNAGLTYLVSRTIIGPVQQLGEAANQIKAGNLNQAVDTNYKGELGDLATSFEAMRKSLKDAQEKETMYEQNRRELISSISHDLRTPVTSIKGYVQGVSDGVANTPEKLNRYMKTISQKTNELERMIDELFLFSKLDVEQVPLQYSSIDIDHFLRDIIEEWSFQYPEIIFDYQTGRITDLVSGDREQLYRVVSNILHNGWKYKGALPLHIAIFVEQVQDEIKIAITDNGIGIAQGALPGIFDPFYRSDYSRNSETGGSGLGLAIVKKIVEAHGGEVYAKSEMNLGTTIYFSIKAGEQHETSIDH